MGGLIPKLVLKLTLLKINVQQSLILLKKTLPMKLVPLKKK